MIGILEDLHLWNYKKCLESLKNRYVNWSADGSALNPRYSSREIQGPMCITDLFQDIYLIYYKICTLNKSFLQISQSDKALTILQGFFLKVYLTYARANWIWIFNGILCLNWSTYLVEIAGPSQAGGPVEVHIYWFIYFLVVYSVYYNAQTLMFCDTAKKQTL